MIRRMQFRQQLALLLLPIVSVALFSSCGGGQASGTGSGQNGGGQGGGAQMTVAVSPSSATVAAGQSQQFTATVNPPGNNTIQWSVNGVYGGSATTGTISQAGLYTAPSIPSKPNTVKVTASCLCGTQNPSADSPVQLTPGFTDFSALPDQINTNLSMFFVSGSANPGDTVTVNGASVPLDSVGNFVVAVPLMSGANPVELDIKSAQTGTSSFTKTVIFDSNFSTAGKRLLYVSSIAQTFPGTVVIDVDDGVFLGFIPNKYVRGISPDGKQIYMHDLSVLSTASHQELMSPSSPLTFSQYIPSDGFLVSPDGTRLYSRDEVLDVATNKPLDKKLPASIETGFVFDGPYQGGPAITPDGQHIFCLGMSCESFDGFSAVARINISDDSITDTGIDPWNFGAYLSDIAVTPNGRFVLLTTYGCCNPGAQIYDATSFKAVFSSAIFLGDFAGQIVVSTDSTKAVFGSAGNPAFQGGAVTVVDLTSWTVKSSLNIDLVDHVAVSDQNQLFVSSGDAPGILMLSLNQDGTMMLQKQFVLGINQFVEATGAPQRDEIEKFVFKPPYAR